MEKKIYRTKNSRTLALFLAGSLLLSVWDIPLVAHAEEYTVESDAIDGDTEANISDDVELGVEESDTNDAEDPLEDNFDRAIEEESEKDLEVEEPSESDVVASEEIEENDLSNAENDISNYGETIEEDEKKSLEDILDENEVISNDREDEAALYQDDEDAASEMFDYYEKSDGTIRIDGYKGEISGSLIIPEKIGDKVVTEIDSCAFYECTGFTGDLIIPSTITSIGYDAFYGCSGFTGDLIIPLTISHIGSDAFYRCSGFSGDLVIPSTTAYIGSTAFRGLYSISRIINESDIVLETSDFIDENDSYFVNESNSSDAVGSGGVISKGTYKRISITEYNNLTYSVKSDGAICITGYVNIPRGNLVIPNMINGLAVTEIGDSAFSNCNGITGTLTLPDSLKRIGSSAFSSCTRISGNLNLPSSIEEIGSFAFSGCKGFSGSLSIPAKLTEIKYGTFEGCSGFTGKLVIPSKVESIDSSAFEDCTGFSGALTLPSGLKSIGSWAFYDCTRFSGKLTLPSELNTIGSGAFSRCGFSGDLIIPSKITSISSGAFSWMKNLTGQLTIPAAIQSLDYEAFNGLEYITKIKNESTLTFPASSFLNSSSDYFKDSTGKKITYNGKIGKGTYTKIVPVQSVGLYPSSHGINRNIVKGQTINLSKALEFYPLNATNQKVTWKTSNKKVATVSSAGVVKGVGVGNATITVTSVDGKKKDTCTVYVKNPVAVKSVKLNKKSCTIKKGKTVKLKAIVSPSNATNKKVTWKSSNKKVATVSASGVVKGVKRGSATISVITTSGKKTAKCKIIVK